jgi:hypothetical protein
MLDVHFQEVCRLQMEYRSEVEYVELRAGQVIAKFSLLEVHTASPHCITISASLLAPIAQHITCNESAFVQRSRSWRLATRRHLECHEAKYAICGDISQISCLRRPSTIRLAAFRRSIMPFFTETRVIPSHECNFFAGTFPRKHFALVKQVQITSRAIS